MGRLLIGVGMIIFFIGFALFAYPIVTAIGHPGFVPPDTSGIPLAFGIAFVGVVLGAIGTFIYWLWEL